MILSDQIVSNTKNVLALFIGFKLVYCLTPLSVTLILAQGHINS